jgi:hypothetical protein
MILVSIVFSYRPQQLLQWHSGFKSIAPEIDYAYTQTLHVYSSRVFLK